VRRAVYTGRLALVGPPRPRLRPACLLADSALLFDRRERLVPRLREMTGSPSPRAAYVGASNGDDPAFYEMFAAAMTAGGIGDVRMIPAAPSDDDRAFLASAHLVLLAGGDVERGWRAMRAGGVADAVVRRWSAGAVLVGVSAGAVQLGTHGWRDGAAPGEGVFPTFGIVPFVLSAHDEAARWGGLSAALRRLGPGTRGLGLPSGGGAFVGPDGAVRALRKPVHAAVATGDGVAARLLAAA
jgi:cyanophycinase-like exopeptidase